MTQIDNVTYGTAGQMLGLRYATIGYSETRAYDSMYRLTGVSGTGGGVPTVGLTYRYPANNGGRIDQATEVTGSGTNTVSYQLCVDKTR